MPTPHLPEPIAAYFAADAQGPEHLARCFAPDAVVTDEEQSHVGREAIQAWKARSSTQYAYTTQALRAEQRARGYVVHGRVTGNFRGSPVELQYLFRLEGGLISQLEITP